MRHFPTADFAKYYIWRKILVIFWWISCLSLYFLSNADRIFKSIIQISRKYDKKFFLVGALAMRLTFSVEDDSEYKTNIELLTELLRGIRD